MSEKRPKRPRDTNQLGKLMVDILTGQVEDHAIGADRNEGAATRGRLGGQARKAATTPEQRKSIAEKAAEKRWENR
jgi:hypothetical protein